MLEAQDTPINVNLSPDYEGAEGRNSKYIGYKVTKKASEAIRDIRVTYGLNRGEFMMGVANYAECGSNGDITLYMNGFNSAGTPILAEGIGLLAGVIVTLGTQNIFKRKKKIINEA